MTISNRILSCVPKQIKQITSQYSSQFSGKQSPLQTRFVSLCTAIVAQKKDGMANLVSIYYM